MREQCVLLGLAGAIASAFAGLLCWLLWGFYWHAVVWCAFCVVTFCLATVSVYCVADHVAAWRLRAEERAREL